MEDLQTYLKLIAKATYGKDVRQSIIDAIQIAGTIPIADEILCTRLLSLSSAPDEIVPKDSVLTAISKLRAFCRANIAKAEGFSADRTLDTSGRNGITENTTIADALSILYAHARTTGYGTCDTGSLVTAKVGVLSGFVLTKGSVVYLKFANANSALKPTLNVNNTGAFGVVDCYTYSNIDATAIKAGMLAHLVYDGENWVLMNPNS